MSSEPAHPFLAHLTSSQDLVTTYEMKRAGFVSEALEKNRLATPYVSEARVLQTIASRAENPRELLNIPELQHGLWTAAGLSNKALKILSQSADRDAAVLNLIENFLEPAGAKFVEELVFRFLLTSGDSLGGSSRNKVGLWAQHRVVRTLISTLLLADATCQWLPRGSKEWLKVAQNDAGVEERAGGLSWANSSGDRTLMFNLTVPLVKNNIDMCLFALSPKAVDVKTAPYKSYLALGELKGGFDPAGADEHWKTAGSAVERIRVAFSKEDLHPALFFVAAAIEERMADDIWTELVNERLENAANLGDDSQITSLCRWILWL